MPERSENCTEARENSPKQTRYALQREHEKPHRQVEACYNHERYADRNCSVPDELAPVHRSSRMPLKTGWRTLPSADFARYSISASNEGSTQTPRCAILFA
jgi:hypothetical protein